MAAPSLVISEIFFSIQGESSWAGLPCIFVRLSFCNLRCRWCDSAYTFHEGEAMTLDQVMEAVRRHPGRLVEVTGGEPLLQEPVLPLMTALCDEGYTVLLETSGSVDIGPVDPRVKRIVDLKCPGSGMADRNRWKNLDLLREADELKFVLADRADYDWAAACLRERPVPPGIPVLFSPVYGELAYRDLAQWILADGLDVRMQIQMHKHIWDPKARGV